MKKYTRLKHKVIYLMSIMLLLSTFIPAQIILSPSHDAYIQGGDNSNINYGSETLIRTKGSDNENFCRKGLLQFDLSSLTSVSSAILKIYVSNANPYSITAYQTTDDWDENTVTWNSAPSLGDAISTTTISNEYIYYEWDVTSFIQEQLLSDAKASIYLVEASLSKKNIDFNSKEAGPNMPELVISEKEINYASLPALMDAQTYYWGSKKYIANYGSETNLKIKLDGLSKASADAYLMFDISDITTPRQSVLLKMFANTVLRNTLVSIYGVNDKETWDEASITGKNKPIGNERIGVYPLSGEGFVSFDITDHFNKAIANNQQSLTLVLKENEGTSVAFNSSEAATNQPEILYAEQTSPYPTSTTLPIYGTFYIDNEEGNDDNDGTSEDTAWKNISKLSKLSLEAGSRILLKRGCTWERQMLSFIGSGTEDKPIVIDAYGSGTKPCLKGNGALYNVIYLFNQEYIEISNLDIQNQGATLDNLRRGIYVLADNFGVVHHLEFKQIDFSNINGSDGRVSGTYGNSDDEKRSSGILIEVRGDDIQTYYDGLVIDQCSFYEISNTGIANSSHWTQMNSDSDWDSNNSEGTSNAHYVHNFVPNKNVWIKRNRFENINSQGLIVRTAENPIMEYNLFYYCSLGDGSDNACFNSKTTNAIWRYNESCYTQWVEGQGDGAGIDSDIRTKNTIIEYNYCHHNQYGGIITTGGRFDDSFNDNTIIRYNILINNGHNSIRLCNNNTHTKIYNNLVYYDDASEINRLIFQHLHNDTQSGPTDTYVNNNIFYTSNNNGRFMADVEWTDSRVQRCNYSNNLFYGIYTNDPYPADPHKIITDPLFVDATVPPQQIGGYILLNKEGIPTGEINPAFLSGFTLSDESPAIDAGIWDDNTANASVDFNKLSIPLGTSIEIGPFEHKPSSYTKTTELNDEPNSILIYPIPSKNKTIVSCQYPMDYISIYTITGHEIKHINKIKTNDYTLDLQSFSSGIYLIKIKDTRGTLSTGKIIVK